MLWHNAGIFEIACGCPKAQDVTFTMTLLITVPNPPSPSLRLIVT
jgi:hypothetical protein